MFSGEYSTADIGSSTVCNGILHLLFLLYNKNGLLSGRSRTGCSRAGTDLPDGDVILVEVLFPPVRTAIFMRSGAASRSLFREDGRSFTNCTRRVQQYAFSIHRLFGLHLDVDVDTCGHLQSLKSVDSLLCGSDDVDQALVCALLELFARIFIFMDGTEDGNNLFLSRERNGAADL